MVILGTGVDIAENYRFEKLLDQQETAFFIRIFTADERNYCDRYPKNRLKAQHYAARFAAKEALVKALGTGFRKMNFHDLEVRNDSLGAPYFEISGRVKEMVTEKRIERIHLSLSHSDNYSIAFVVLEGKEAIVCE